MNGIAAAFGATGLYYVGFAIFFKLAADRAEPLRVNRIGRMVWMGLTRWVFLTGLGVMICGLSLQIIAMGELSLGVAIPIFMSGLLPLLLISMIFFGERLTPREWLSLLLVASVIALLALSVRDTPPITTAEAPVWKLAAAVVPALLVPLMILVVGDVRPAGRHARPVTDIAYGLASGFPVGAAELAIKGWSDAGAFEPDVLATPYPYVTVVAATIGFAIMVAAFQRCRVSIVATVMTVAAKTYLLIMGTLLYDEPWPQDRGYSALRLGALALATIAVLQFPRHRPVAETAEDNEGQGEAPDQSGPALARDPFGGVPLSRDPLSRSSLAQAPLAAPHQQPPGQLHVQPPAQPYDPPPSRHPYANDPLGRGPDGPQNPGSPLPEEGMPAEDDRPPEAQGQQDRHPPGDATRR
jgi:multidrug transporter EmrE-like cation transporter